MYGDCQVLMSSTSGGGGRGTSSSVLGGQPPGTTEENNMMMASSSSDHHHHHRSSNPFHHHGFFPSLLDRNPNHNASSNNNNNMNFNFMSPVSLPSFHNPFTSLIPKEEMLNSGMMLGLRRGGGGGPGGGKDEMDSNISGGSEQMHELDGGGTLNDLEISTHLLDHHHHPDDSQLQPPPPPGGPGTTTTTTKKKRYHRHTAHQIQELEAMFKECPHPDDKQRMKLSQELGLKPRQVKFWFQNRRTQMKAQQDRADNAILRAENESLKTENYRLQALMRSLMCPNCGNSSIFGEVAYDEQQLRLENNRLKEELDRLCSMASRYSGRPLPSLCSPSLDLDMNIYSRHFQEPHPVNLAPPHPSDHHQAMIGCGSGIAPFPLLPPDHTHHHHQSGAGSSSPFPTGGILLDEEKPIAMELALSSLEEVLKMCQANEPLWIQSSSSSDQVNGGSSLSSSCSHINCPMEVLNVEEYGRMFPYWGMNGVDKQNRFDVECSRREATRHSALVIMNSLNLVDAFIDANKWIDLFPSMVSRAKTIQMVASGVHGHASGSLHLMYAEFQVLSPLVPTREAHFLRYCHHNAEDGIWSIVDFPIDTFHCSGILQMSHPPPRYRRRPSGCVIQDMPNGYSKVTWVEHAEILLEEKPVPQIFNKYVTSGMAYGAHRWLAVLQRQCERVASQMARNICDVGVIQSAESRKNLMRLSQRMIRTFCHNMSTAGGQSWTTVTDSTETTVRITIRQMTEPGQPSGVILSAASTTWLPFPHDQVFHFLKNEHKRSQLDSLSNGNSLHEVAHIANGSDPGNCISLLRINVASNSSQNVDLMLQESCTDSSGSLIVYTTVEVNYIQLVMSGEDPSCIPLLPLGFSIIPLSQPTDSTAAAAALQPPPHSPSNSSAAATATATAGGADSSINSANIAPPPAAAAEGCLLTLGLQTHASTIPTAKLNLSCVKAINNHLSNAVHQINAALMVSTTSSSAASPSNNNNGLFAAAASCPTIPPPPHHHHHHHQSSPPAVPDHNNKTSPPPHHKQ